MKGEDHADANHDDDVDTDDATDDDNYMHDIWC